MLRLGGSVITTENAREFSSAAKGESLQDSTRIMNGYADVIVMRHNEAGSAARAAEVSSIPIINGLTDYTHPCQAMADFLTIKEYKCDFKGLKLCYVGDGNNVAHSLMFTGARLGVDVTVACPAGYEPNLIAFQYAVEDAKATGAKIEVVHDPAEGVKDADAVYTDVWASMGQEAEAAERRRIFLPFQVNEDLMAKAKSDAIFMHCLPAHRGEEVTAEVIDGPASVVWDEAENRMYAQKALMEFLLT